VKVLVDRASTITAPPFASTSLSTIRALVAPSSPMLETAAETDTAAAAQPTARVTEMARATANIVT